MNIIEINGNLKEEQNFCNFKKYILDTIEIFYDIFGKEIMGKYDLFIDNGLSNTGYTPVITPLLKKHLTIKLGVKDFSNSQQIVYQLSHELCHYVFYSIAGLDKEKADVEEENICSAMSIIILNEMFPESTASWIEYVKNIENPNYNKGSEVAIECSLNTEYLKKKIMKKAQLYNSLIEV